MSQYKTITEYPGDDVTTMFAVTFPYLELTDVKVYIDGVSTAAFTTDGLFVTMDVAPATGEIVSVRREIDRTDINFLFGDRSVLRNQNVDGNNTQLLYGLQEDFDLLEAAGMTNNSVAEAEAAAAAAAASAVEAADSAAAAADLVGGTTRTITASEVLVQSDVGKILLCDHASVPIVLTLPDDAATTWPAVGNIGIVWQGTAAVSVVGSGDTAFINAELLSLRKQGAAATAIIAGTDLWVFSGDVSTA